MSSQTIAIIGAGFSGAITAVHLLKGNTTGNLRVVLISRTERMGQGLAYGTSSESHALNVPAGQMSAFPDEPDHFMNWLRRLNPNAQPGDFVRRYLYGAYLEEQLHEAERTTRCVFERSVGIVSDIEVPEKGNGIRLSFTDGRTLDADRVVLAVGNFPPLDPRSTNSEFYKTPRYVRDPWDKGRLASIKETDIVLFLGTGLTMVDIATELHKRGISHMVGVSRRGLFPKAHRYPAKPPRPGLLPPQMLERPHTARTFLNRVRRQIDICSAQGVDWRDVIASLRPVTQQLWELLSASERGRFLRHVRPYWEVHRHRIAPEAAFIIERLVSDGILKTVSGRVVGFEWTDSDVMVDVKMKGVEQPRQFRVNYVINCTGPGTNVGVMEDPLIQALRRRSLIVSDGLGLGVETDEYGALRQPDGSISSRLYHVGPLLKSRFWECTAVPELRIQAKKLATVLLRPE
jgi:uncharacterized NAD(P)/FAD-binding protein YdhS